MIRIGRTRPPAWLRQQARYCAQHAMVTDHPVIRDGLLACAAALHSEALALDRVNHKPSQTQHNRRIEQGSRPSEERPTSGQCRTELKPS